MKAVVYNKKASPNTLILSEVEKPQAADNEVLIKIVATSVNAADYRSMKMGIIPKKKIFGSDIAGRVEAVGKSVTRFAVGDEVVADLSGCGFGGFAEYVAVPESALSAKPVTIPFETAAAVPMAAVTALQALRNKGGLQAGQKVLICGAGGGVGTFAVQLAVWLGAEVTAVCGEKNAEMIQSLGAKNIIDYTKEDFTKTDSRYHLILAVNGGYPISAYKRLLEANGVIVMIGGALTQVLQVMLFGGLMSIGSKKVRLLAAKPDTKDLSDVIRLVEEGKIKPVIDRNYPLAETAHAVHYLSEGHARGKVIINIFNTVSDK